MLRHTSSENCDHSECVCGWCVRQRQTETETESELERESVCVCVRERGLCVTKTVQPNSQPTKQPTNQTTKQPNNQAAKQPSTTFGETALQQRIAVEGERTHALVCLSVTRDTQLPLRTRHVHRATHALQRRVRPHNEPVLPINAVCSRAPAPQALRRFDSLVRGADGGQGAVLLNCRGAHP